ncbi:LuxR family transcriptional regulator [Kitasatospora paracochleata]|uniref:DNA-binding CsgD family transcriptional regulator n=1 Tax=Kitasatospora paracochleata TaxID=58354 RepID=A0ABT1J5Y1_9ACTN|nr:LuxR family transcriptional regulator [Kitasatospora paracochleata]MCP2312847.1 DNA-binding CsgD family transcriptional regulator [Kitasatospora paracochleata]
MLYGREREQAVLDGLLAEARGGGRSGVLVLRGEPGIGKSALLDHAVEAAGESFRVIRAAGVEYEAELPFAGLSLLFGPVVDRLGALPGPQRRALEAAFGLAEGGAADRLLTGLAVLGLLGELAAERPLLCVVDDVQWLDGASLDAVLLAARRLQAEGVVLLLAVRDGGGSAQVAAGLPELRLEALGDTDAGRLLDARLGGVAEAGEARARLLAEAAGNPLALCELPVGAGVEGRSAGAAGLPLTSRLVMAFHGQVTVLPAACQTLLLVAAAEEQGELDVVLAAGAVLGADGGQLAPAEEAGLVATTLDRRLVFRHPLLRAAILQRGPLQQRLAAHRAIGEVLEDGDRRTWHLALAATGVDAELADALERTAVRSAARGGPGSAAAYERAARLTPDRDGATRRLVLAAEAATAEGRLGQAEVLADRAAARTDRADVHALLDHVRATAHFWRGSYPAAYRLLVAAAGAEVEPSHAARMLLQAFHAAWYVGEEPVVAVLERLAALELAAGDPLTPLVGYLPAAVFPAVGRPAAVVPAVRDVVAAARGAGAETPGDLVQLCGATLVAGRDDETLELAGELIAEARGGGAVGVLPTLQFFLAEAELFHGRHREAEVTAGEALALARDTGQYQWVSQLSALLACLAALAGDAERCAELAAAALGTVAPAGAAPQSAAPAAGEPWAQWALGLLDLGQGRAGEALDRLGGLAGGNHRHHVGATRAVPDLVEAAVRLGAAERAAEPYERFARWAGASGRPWAEALRLRCQALLGPDELAESAYRAALKLHEGTGRPFEQARTALLYGEWLRRERRRTDARPYLRGALEVFERLGARPWADRARGELTATGTVAPAPAEEWSALSVLTPQEAQIVRLAAQGLTNRDIAAQLFLSPRTVGHHLYKAYPKLGIASRGELAGLV